jgi:cytochrome c-type biogenesis protein CcmH/NrfG
VTGILIAAAAIAIPCAVFVLWPLLRRRGAPVLLPLPPDPREPLLERKQTALRALRELDFEHESGHVSDDDYADLRARYEAETAAVLAELDRLGSELAPPPPPPRAAVAARATSAWRQPVALGAGAVALVVFGVALGVGIMRYTEPDRSADAPMPGSRPLASLDAPGAPASPAAPGGAPAAGGNGPLSPEVLRGMLQAARQSLEAERFSEAISAYQAVLRRDPSNVDAMTHLGLIVAMGGHADSALDTFSKALSIDPNYAPALLYRGQVLYEAKRDTAGAIAAWEKFLAVSPPGAERERVAKLIADAKAGGAPKR